MANRKSRKRKTYSSFDLLLVGHLLPKIINKNEKRDTDKEDYKEKHHYHLIQTRSSGPFIQKMAGTPKIHWIEWCYENKEDAEEIFEAVLRSRSIDTERLFLTPEKEKLTITQIFKKKKPKEEKSEIPKTQKTVYKNIPVHVKRKRDSAQLYGKQAGSK